MTAKRKIANAKTPAKTPAKPYEPTPRARAALEAHFARAEEKPPAPAWKIEAENGFNNISNDHPDQTLGLNLLMEATGTTDFNFLRGLLCQLAEAGTKNGEVNEDAVNFMLSVVKGVEPKDQMEAMLAAQMAAVHMATITFARRLANVENIPQQDAAERGFNKLARTFTTQMEALKRYRTGGQQKVTVEHVTVNEGGQAIVGNVETGGRGALKKSETTS